MDADVFFCYFLPNRGSWRQPRSSCVPPPTYHPQRPESHEESPSYSWYKNAYFRSFLKTDSPIGCIVTLHWLHDRAFGTLSLRENDLSSIFVRYFIHIRSGVRCEKYYGSSMFVLERPLGMPLPSREKSAVFLNIVQKAFDPPPPFV